MALAQRRGTRVNGDQTSAVNMDAGAFERTQAALLDEGGNA